jgi:hypothetical protein
MTTIKLFELVGSFAEDKDLAKNIRVERIEPAIIKEDDIILNFEGVESATQSFIHALISDLIRKHGSSVLEKIKFESCSDSIKKIIGIVTDYMQEG